jgi:hypothetical protein
MFCFKRIFVFITIKLIGVMFTSLKVVNMAVSFWQLLISLLLYDATSIILYALFHENHQLSSHRRHCIYSILLVILPAFPVMDAGAIFFSSNIFWLLEMEFLKRKLLLELLLPEPFWLASARVSGSTVL